MRTGSNTVEQIKNMRTKYILALAPIAAFLLVAPAYGQNNILPSLVAGGTTNIAATTTNTGLAFGAFVLPPDSKVMSVALTCKLTGAGTSAVRLYLDKSIDNSNWATNAANCTVTSAGTVAQTSITDIDSGGARFWRLSGLGNANANAATNFVIMVGAKRGL